ncbi:lipoprotein insertase outer membrane protein LolB [Acinetobacter baretiae]|uniref:lipoprotein insertase outer membrane protein LolB n=1 Tax=Acinetobacter baretiae TaxID=2605383 RepID=UPI0038B29225
MPSPMRTHLLFISSFVILLTGCQQYQRTVPTIPSMVNSTPSTTQAPSNQFAIQGKIGIKTPTQSGSAFFTWQQDQDTFNIELAGALGIGKTNIQGNAHQATLMSAKTGTIVSNSPEELLEQATGWSAPIHHLIPWTQGYAATPKAHIKYDEQHRISELDEDHWLVNFSYNTDHKLPYRVILKQAIEKNQENKITLVIENR